MIRGVQSDAGLALDCDAPGGQGKLGGVSVVHLEVAGVQRHLARCRSELPFALVGNREGD